MSNRENKELAASDEQHAFAERMLDCYPTIGYAAKLLAAREADLLVRERAFILEVLHDFERLAKAGNSSQQSGANAVIAGLRAAIAAKR
jgi:hypothetical protein